MNESPFFDKVKKALLIFWEWIKPYLIKFHKKRQRVWKRYQINKIILLTVLTIALAASVYLLYLAKTANVSTLKAGLEQTTTIYDVNNEEAGTLYSQKGTFVSIDEVSDSIEQAVISTEDKRFYKHSGFDPIGIARAAVGYILNGGNIVGGGSTITQQLAKNAYLTLDQTVIRKLKELFLAIEIEKVYTKDEIIEMYLNNSYFGNGVWGVEDASQKYFGKSAADVTLSEAATIAGMLKAPSNYNPIDNYDNAISRRNVVLDLMATNELVTQEEVDELKAQELTLVDAYSEKEGYQYPSYFDAVINEAMYTYDLSEEAVLNKGYKIYTSLNQDYQRAMDVTYENDYLFQNAADGTLLESGSVALDPETGGVFAIYGGRKEHTFRGFNYATQMVRQPGSIIKPLAVYTAALEQGYSIDSMLVDEPLPYGKDKYTPENVDDQYEGEVPMYQALAESKNAPAVWLLNEIGLNKGFKKVEEFGIPLVEGTEGDEYLGLALGGLSKGVSPLQMASAYTTFANEGVMSEGHFITKIVDATGAVIVDNTNSKKTKITTPEVADQMTSMLMGVFTNGTAQNNNPSGYTIAGKTGSTEVTFNDSGGTTDQWTVGYTPDIVIATWMGFDPTDENHYMTTGSSTGVGPLFKQQMENILPYTELTAFNTQSAEKIVAEEAENEDGSNDWKQDVKDTIDSIGGKVKEGSDILKDKFGNLLDKFTN
ncbi:MULTISPECIES: PBP1A family penicillin-binding protein [Carnobacterium]|uniref:Penicillin-binding protein 1A n=1 Tax=Carnobacterium inhibens subsp. gilichinskyi TaxID=1266845 RepID=U5S7U3_9LACT|nr:MULTISPECIES: PBP1A family penicillin-binding protein [Carnobacterium]AGY81295.1 penicillin-binding protein 1A [Carnobacterium inhibens subsp. gilichinskyi]MCM3512959.1 PBP1A family penicillin-binding protein [Carnobacterium inhibens]MDN5371063.1 penicillin-binding protein [Carnobacterium sp.]